MNKSFKILKDFKTFIQWLTGQLKKLIQYEGAQMSDDNDDIWDSDHRIKELIKLYVKLRNDKPPIPTYLSSKNQKLLYNYWKNEIDKRNDSINESFLEDFYKINRSNRWEFTIKNENLEEFSTKFKLEIRGYLLSKENEMRVIFSTHPNSGVSIVHVKI